MSISRLFPEDPPARCAGCWFGDSEVDGLSAGLLTGRALRADWGRRRDCEFTLQKSRHVSAGQMASVWLYRSQSVSRKLATPKAGGSDSLAMPATNLADTLGRIFGSARIRRHAIGHYSTDGMQGNTSSLPVRGLLQPRQATTASSVDRGEWWDICKGPQRVCTGAAQCRASAPVRAWAGGPAFPIESPGC